MKKIVVIFLCFVSTMVLAVDVRPFEKAKITEEQWENYHSRISNELVGSRRAYEKHYLEVFSDKATRTSIAFTMPGHEAHPAWVTRHVNLSEGTMSIDVIGYFAGSEEAFQKLFRQYQEMARKTQERLKK